LALAVTTGKAVWDGMSGLAFPAQPEAARRMKAIAAKCFAKGINEQALQIFFKQAKCIWSTPLSLNLAYSLKWITIITCQIFWMPRREAPSFFGLAPDMAARHNLLAAEKSPNSRDDPAPLFEFWKRATMPGGKTL
jgi:hypothetical protein